MHLENNLILLVGTILIYVQVTKQLRGTNLSG